MGGSLFCLIIFIVICTIVALYIHNGDILTPSFILCLSYLLSCVVCFLNLRVWGTAVSWQTSLSIMFCLLSFLFGDVVFRMFHPGTIRAQAWENQIIIISRWKILFVIIIDIVTILALYKIVVQSGTASMGFQELLMNYREENTISSPIVNFMVKIVRGFSYAFLFVYINNMFADRNKGKVRRNIIYLIPVLFWPIRSILNGGRNAILTMIIAAIVIWFVMTQRNCAWHYHIKVKQIMKLLFLMLLVLFLFGYLKEFFGRVSKEETMFSYVSKYIGGSIELFNQYVSKYGLGKRFMVWSAFPSMAESMRKLGILSVQISEYSLSNSGFWFSSTGILIGNTFTGIAGMLMGGGLTLACFMYFLMAYLFNYAYRKIKLMNYFNIRGITFIIIWAYTFYGLLFQGIADFFYYNISIGWFIEMIIQYLCICFLLKLRVRLG